VASVREMLPIKFCVFCAAETIKYISYCNVIQKHGCKRGSYLPVCSHLEIYHNGSLCQKKIQGCFLLSTLCKIALSGRRELFLIV